MNTIESKTIWQCAAKLAATKHQHQLRKDHQTPYISHTVRVVLTLQHIFGISDPVIHAAALLHDTIEDTACDFDDIEEACGPDVAGMVALLSKDPRIREDRREELYFRQLAEAEWSVQAIKLADVYDNFCDSIESGIPGSSHRKNALKMLQIVKQHPCLEQAVRALKSLISEQDPAANVSVRTLAP